MQLYRSVASFAIRWTMNAYLLTVARAGGALHSATARQQSCAIDRMDGKASPYAAGGVLGAS